MFLSTSEWGIVDILYKIMIGLFQEKKDEQHRCRITPIGKINAAYINKSYDSYIVILVAPCYVTVASSYLNKSP